MNDSSNLDETLSSHAQKNRTMWDASSDSYEQLHNGSLAGRNALAWGLWRIPEIELNVLGDVAGKDVLEFGCGAARWSIALAKSGARPVGDEPSELLNQLSSACRLERLVDVSRLHPTALAISVAPIPSLRSNQGLSGCASALTIDAARSM